MDKPRVGVIGVGKMGRHHARAYAQLEHLCRFVGVCDLDETAGQAVVQRYGGTFFKRPEDLMAEVDAVTIAVPTREHLPLGLMAVEAGIHFLMEKPVCMDVREAEILQKAASRRGMIAQVGHIERFNPALQEVARILEGHRPVAVDARRMGPFDPRVRDMDVVQDLMIHDLDIVRYLFPGKVTALSAMGRSVKSERAVDYAVATLSLEDGLIVNLTASRVTEQKVRVLAITTETAYIELDYVERRISISRRSSMRFDGEPQPAFRMENVGEQVFVTDREPIVAQTEHFLQCIRTGHPPLVGLVEGLEALRAVSAIQALVYSGSRAVSSVAV